MNLKVAMVLIAGSLLALSANVLTAAAAEIKISGAAAVAGAILTPNKAAIESETGLTVNMVANGDCNGVKDLYAGKVDASSAPNGSSSSSTLGR